jgi:hypothetical protein
MKRWLDGKEIFVIHGELTVDDEQQMSNVNEEAACVRT